MINHYHAELFSTACLCATELFQEIQVDYDKTSSGLFYYYTSGLENYVVYKSCQALNELQLFVNKNYVNQLINMQMR